MSQPLLSIGMIVKNEERCLEKCLKALEPLRQAIPCELVIADTGSTDKTREIASKYADILFDFKWVNDFSVARNAVMDKCTGKWYLTVDADEYLSSSVDEIVSFLTGPLSSKNIHASITQRNFANPDMSGVYSDFNAIRMVRMNTNKRYEGAIHESFPLIELELTHILTNTIFDHDGYTPISPKHLQEKARRNLEILEKQLENEPNNIRCIVQCLEVCGQNLEKRRYFSEYAIEKLKKAPASDIYISGFGPVCAKEVIKTMLVLKDPSASNFADWAFNRFPKSFHILIDVNYLFAKEVYANEDFEQCIKYCQDYLTALNSYTKRKSVSSYDAFVSSPDFVHEYFKYEIQTLLANALINLKRVEEALKILDKIDLSKIDNNSITNWFSAILNTKATESVSQTAAKVIDDLLRNHHDHKTTSNNAYEFVISTISKPFSCNQNVEQDYNVFALVSGAIGLSVKIANAKTKEEIEKCINKIEIWEEVMPLAICKAIEADVVLPKEFYLMNPQRLNYISQDLICNIKKISTPLIENTLNTEKHQSLPEINFAHNLLLNLLFSSKFNELNTQEKFSFTKAFLNISDIYLNTCFVKNMLESEELMACTSITHLFSWYCVKAAKEKEENPLKYLKILRQTINKVPQAKIFIEFLIEEYKREDENRKKQESIKKAPPELIAMAEQLKTMLSAFAPDDPQLLAIKQSPMYKQVAFLIED